MKKRKCNQEVYAKFSPLKGQLCLRNSSITKYTHNSLSKI